MKEGKKRQKRQTTQKRLAKKTKTAEVNKKSV
jgi:hypothetical protein